MSFSTSFQMEKSQIVAPLTKIVALLEKYLWGAFWRFWARKRALSDSEHLKTLVIIVSQQVAFMDGYEVSGGKICSEHNINNPQKQIINSKHRRKRFFWQVGRDFFCQRKNLISEANSGHFFMVCR